MRRYGGSLLQQARNQSELVDSLSSKQIMMDDKMEEHPLCQKGFTIKQDGAILRMDQLDLVRTIRTLLQSRPTLHKLIVKPKDMEVTEKVFMDHSNAGYRMNMETKAKAVAEQFAYSPRVVGFWIELHGLENRDAATTPSVSMGVFEALEVPKSHEIPMDITVRYRSNF